MGLSYSLEEEITYLEILRPQESLEMGTIESEQHLIITA